MYNALVALQQPPQAWIFWWAAWMTLPY